MSTISAAKISSEIPNGNYSHLFSKYNKLERNAHFSSVTLPYIWGKLRWGGKCTSRLTNLNRHVFTF
jgi:hypothetical protein